MKDTYVMKKLIIMINNLFVTIVNVYTKTYILYLVEINFTYYFMSFSLADKLEQNKNLKFYPFN